MNNIILDIEWDCTEKNFKRPVIIQIGAIKTDENNNYMDEYYTILKPDDGININIKILNFMKLSSETVSNGLGAKEALKDFIIWCGEDFNVITWGYEPLQVFLDNIKSYNLEFKHDQYYNIQYIVSRILKSDNSFISFKEACDSYGISKEKQFHNNSCRHIQKIEVRNLKGYGTYKGAVKKGYIPCKHCICKSDFIPTINLTDEKSGIEKINLLFDLCKKYGLEYYLYGSYLFIKTKISMWYFDTNENKSIKLYHQNSNVKKKFKTNYHIQKKTFSTYTQVIKYIKNHDEYKYKRQSFRYLQVDNMFQKI